MTGKPLDELYFEWLYSQVARVSDRNPARSYWCLLNFLYRTEFVWFVANDDNRMEDGRDLRREFIEEYDLDEPDSDWLTIGCSMLEMCIGLSRRLSFEDEVEEDTTVAWFWHLMANIGLRAFTDQELRTEEKEAYVVHILEEVIWRTYQSNGRGGLFPLRNPHEDQRQVELWYQLSSYLMEGHSAE
ncbi:hypothetical protein HWC06_gp58 [Gordonia phage Duffington]|uniref:Uncharacterized protein n=1 Tax=Gordonia phage Duffington TaxID=2507858 RepID=A0A410TCL7_9CAUD|nr:hypothetical protein HWC06_gp58 [Gordonia phage Duffington]QAU06764.1 hypothetical protein SEA_DUFFINGTON_58 [Gordonia phage Duffington]QXO13065.1 hypothetical protein SEA_FIGLIAR_58 [Gordonia phage Figliar]